ncbi:hypothetical protein BH23CHL5_BH23CHL5_11120 [soil metagenome]
MFHQANIPLTVIAFAKTDGDILQAVLADRPTHEIP